MKKGSRRSSSPRRTPRSSSPRRSPRRSSSSPRRSSSPHTSELNIVPCKNNLTPSSLIYTLETFGGIDYVNYTEMHFDSLEAATLQLEWILEWDNFDKSLRKFKKDVKVAFAPKGSQYLEVDVAKIEGLDFYKRYTIYSWSLNKLQLKTVKMVKIK